MNLNRISVSLMLGASLLMFSACSSVRWSGHPPQASPTPERGSPETHDARGHKPPLQGLPLHQTEGRSPVYNIPDKPGPHTVNSLLYGQRADQFRQEAATHHSMKELYKNDPEMTAHCDKLIKQFTDLAAEYEAISKLHEKRAEESNEPLLKELRK